MSGSLLLFAFRLPTVHDVPLDHTQACRFDSVCSAVHACMDPVSFAESIFKVKSSSSTVCLSLRSPLLPGSGFSRALCYIFAFRWVVVRCGAVGVLCCSSLNSSLVTQVLSASFSGLHDLTARHFPFSSRLFREAHRRNLTASHILCLTRTVSDLVCPRTEIARGCACALTERANAEKSATEVRETSYAGRADEQHAGIAQFQRG
jgi:hypothetical protein